MPDLAVSTGGSRRGSGLHRLPDASGRGEGVEAQDVWEVGDAGASAPDPGDAGASAPDPGDDVGVVAGAQAAAAFAQCHAPSTRLASFKAAVRDAQGHLFSACR
jgi:hypothetical protein